MQKQLYTIPITFIAVIFLLASGCTSGPYTVKETLSRDGFEEGSETVHYDGEGNLEVISRSGDLPPGDESGPDAIEDGRDSPFDTGAPGQGLPGME